MTGHRGDRVLYDDPHSVEGALSEVQRTTVLRVFAETVTTRLNSPERSAIVVVMQRLHEQDLSGASSSASSAIALCLPMEFEPERRCVTSKLTLAELKLGDEWALDITRGGIGDFGFLGESLAEAENVEKAYAARHPAEPAPVVLSGSAASDGTEALATPPRVLHLATHGFYLANGRGGGPAAAAVGGGARRREPRLAGGPAEAGENGVLHAEEVQGLNLEGTELVVLVSLRHRPGGAGLFRRARRPAARLPCGGGKERAGGALADRRRAGAGLHGALLASWLAQAVSDPARALQETKLEYVRSDDPAETDPERLGPLRALRGIDA